MKNMDIREFVKNNIVVMDGALGTVLHSMGLGVGEYTERLNITSPEVIRGIHLDYFNSGANVVVANTFGASLLKFDKDELEKIIAAAFENARWAREHSDIKGEKFIALDIGPLGRLLKPFGDLDFNEAVDVFAETVRLGAKYGAELIFIETMNDSYETKAAVLAAKENSCLPIWVSNAYREDGKLMTGASASAMVSMLEGLGVDAIGANCSLGPDKLTDTLCEIRKYSSLPVIFKPNAGLPKIKDGRTVYDIEPSEFSKHIRQAAELGANIVGGCCGTSPEYIRLVTGEVEAVKPLPITDKGLTSVSSYTHSVFFGKSPVMIGERINPTGKKHFKQALIDSNIDYILNEAICEEDSGAHILDVNVGIPDIDDKELLPKVVAELQAVTALPLQIDTADPEAMERALRIYNGKPMINSVNGKRESMERIFPLAKKYGGLIVALTLDEDGIPTSAEGRVKIAEKILKTAEGYGISRKDIIFDPLTMSISADPDSARVTLDALKMIKQRLGALTSLGVSNISFGLPSRDVLNSSFLVLALQNGLDAAIINPHSRQITDAAAAFSALNGEDCNFEKYIASQTVGENTKQQKLDTDAVGSLKKAIIRGLRSEASSITRELLLTSPAMKLLENDVIPALDTVGRDYEEGRAYLPSLLMSAEAAKAAFEEIRAAASVSGNESRKKGTVVLATVEGDIHDIGKNIVKLLLENYGFNVIDLGRDVPPSVVFETVESSNAELVGLSALMTTTVPAMKKTVELLKRELPSVRVVVGGAVLTEEYALRIGADKYARDAMETVRYAESVCRREK